MSTGDDEIQVIVFTVGEHHFAFEISQVERIMRFRAPTPLPKAAEFLEGMIRFGERLVPLVDLRKRLGAEAAMTDEARIVVIEVEGQAVGVLVDQVLEVIRVNAGTITAPPAMVRGLAATYITGMVRHGEETLVLLHAGKLFTSTERILLAETGAAAGTGIEHA
jgi:purine-binding chemotaxis protein CheW